MTWNTQTTVDLLLLHFENDIKRIVHTITGKSSRRDLVQRTVEECYNQARIQGGVLDPAHWVESPNESDSDFQPVGSADYVVIVDQWNDYKREAWLDFWTTAIKRTPTGPTLFTSAVQSITESKDTTLPRYLFRISDSTSSGFNNNYFIMSAARKALAPGSRDDILGKASKIAAKLLYKHLKNCSFMNEANNNLVSWASSLLFAIQYAIYR